MSPPSRSGDAAGAAALLLTLLASAASAQTVAIEQVRVLPMDTDDVLETHTIVIEDGLVTELGPSTSVVVPPGVVRVDGTGKTVVPGLIECHAHLFDPGDVVLLVAHGVTGALNMSGGDLHLRLRNEIARGRTVGPTLLTTGPMLMPSAPALEEYQESVSSPEQAEAAVRAHVAAGYDLVKVWGSIEPATYAAITGTAAELGVGVTGHVPRDVGLGGVLAAGQRPVAHVEEILSKVFGYADPRAEDLERLARGVARSGGSVITTLVVFEAIAGGIAADPAPLLARPGRRRLDPVRRASWEPEHNRYRTASRTGKDARYRALLEIEQRIALALHEAGVPLLAGTDAGELPGLVPGLDLHRELELLVDAGLDPLEALRCATFHPGTQLFAGAEPVGVIRGGARADLLLLDGDPSEDIAATRRIAAVVLRGRVLTSDDLERLLEDLERRNAHTGEILNDFREHGVERARATAERLATARPEQEVLALRPALRVAQLLFLEDEPAAAESLLELVAERHPQAPEPHWLAGAAALRDGRTARARASLERALALSPGHDRARRMLRTIDDG